MHDKSIIDKEQWEFPNGITIYQDTGYQGHRPENVKIIQAIKKPKGKDLTKEQKQENKEISAIRVKVEHAIGQVKIFRLIKDKIRNWRYNFKDSIMEICSALHNFRINPITY